MSDTCFICEKSFDEAESMVAKARGVKTLLERSIANGRKDHEQILLGVSEIRTHPACYKRYADSRRVENPKKRRRRCSETLITIDAEQSETVEEDVLKTFNFLENCVVCAEKINCIDNPPSKRNYSLVTKPCFRVTVLNYTKDHKDGIGKQIYDRVNDVPDLTAVGARYHHKCNLILASLKQAPSYARKAKNELIDKAMKFIDSYFNEHYNDGKFKFSDLMNCIDMDYIPDRRTIKERLLEIYGDDVLYLETENGKDTVVRFRGYEIDSGEKKKKKRKKPAKPIIFCRCEGNCKSCICQKSGRKCTTACLQCKGESCTNSVYYESSDDECLQMRDVKPSPAERQSARIRMNCKND